MRFSLNLNALSSSVRLLAAFSSQLLPRPLFDLCTVLPFTQKNLALKKISVLRMIRRKINFSNHTTLLMEFFLFILRTGTGSAYTKYVTLLEQFVCIERQKVALSSYDRVANDAVVSDGLKQELV